MIENCIPELEGNELAYVTEAVRAGDLAIGRFIGAFEDSVRTHAGARHAVAVSNGTAALHLALLCAGVGPETEVIVPAVTFAGTVNAVLLCGATPVILDCEAKGWGLDPQALARFLDEDCRQGNDGPTDRRTGRRVSAMVPTHIYGHPADMDPIEAAARRHGVAVVEDAAEALGARYRGRAIGDGTNIAALSFNGNKIVTSAGGGMVLTNDEAIARRARYLANQAKDADIDFVHREAGFNYRLSNVQAAIGLAQCEGLDRRIARKRAIAEAYAEAFAAVPGAGVLREADYAFSSYWMPLLSWDAGLYGTRAVELARELVAEGIGVRPVWRPLNAQPAFADLGGPATPVADDLYGRSLCLPCSTSITDAEIATVVAAIVRRLEKRRAA